MRYSKRLELFEILRGRFAGFLTATLWKLAGDEEIFAEAYQYTLLSIWENLEKLTGPQAGGYIYRIALSANSRAWRNRIGRDGKISFTAETAEEKIKNNLNVESPADSPIGEETLGIVRREIAQLPEKQALAVVMRYIEQNDYREIGEKLNCGEDTARSHVSKAIAALRENLTNKNVTEF